MWLQCALIPEKLGGKKGKKEEKKKPLITTNSDEFLHKHVWFSRMAAWPRQEYRKQLWTKKKGSTIASNLKRIYMLVRNLVDLFSYIVSEQIQDPLPLLGIPKSLDLASLLH